MSFLNSVLSSIGGGGQSNPNVPLNSGSSTIGAASAQQSAKNSTPKNGVRTIDGRLGSGQKRKAEEELSRITGKLPRKDVTTCAQATRPIAQPTKIRTSVTTTSSTVSPSTPSTASPYRGTAKPSVGPKTVPPDRITPKAPPKKGSYAEILARGQAAQTTKTQVGLIKHKPVEKLSKKERLALKASASSKKGEGPKASKDTLTEKSKGQASTGKKEDDKGIKRRPSADISYKGTARPKPDALAYRGTMNRPAPKPIKPASDDRYSDRSRSTSVARQGPKTRYADYSDEDEDEEEEEGDYDSEGSSDMEAPLHEVDEEEELAERAAKKEDQKEAMEEARLKREKEEKKKRLTLLAKNSRR